MKKMHSQVEIFLDDLEIIGLLKDIPPMPGMNDLQILRYMDQESKAKNLIACIRYEHYVYTLIKFDTEGYKEEYDRGLVLFRSHPLYAHEHIELLELQAAKGKGFSQQTFDGAKAQLTEFRNQAILHY